ncbi:MAG TPA: hypothetical protein VMH35_28720 [Streptosporangiaceae bacterium]|nr:hypothetical protein [Streptosporangiaceae bacterium]
MTRPSVLHAEPGPARARPAAWPGPPAAAGEADLPGARSTVPER